MANITFAVNSNTSSILLTFQQKLGFSDPTINLAQEDDLQIILKKEPKLT